MWRGSQSCSLWAQAQQQALYRLHPCAMQRRAHRRAHALEEERDQSKLTESHLQMSNPLSWTRRFRLPRTPSWTGRAGSSSTGSPPLPSPHPPPTPPPLVYQRLNVLQVVSPSVDSLQSLLCWFSPPWSPAIPPTCPYITHNCTSSRMTICGYFKNTSDY